jgi:hypothetical protein
VLTIASQIAIPIIILGSTLRDNDIPTFCPSTGNCYERAVAFFIGIAYLAKLTFLAVSRTDAAGVENPVCERNNTSGDLAFWYSLDRFMNFAYQSLVYLINLWIVFLLPDVLDMVLNALAIEYILVLDDQLKKIFLSTPIFKPNIKAYRKANNESGFNGQPMRKPPSYFHDLLMISSVIIPMVSAVAALAASIYLPTCKASGLGRG